MARIEFLGCGEACDPGEPNTSFLFSARDACMLFDCGFTVPHRLAGTIGDPDRLGGVWISHLHGDHFFGLPLLFLKLSGLGRRRELVLAGPAGLGEKTRALMDMAYDFLARGCGFDWRVIELSPGESTEVAGMRIAAAESIHNRRALSVRCDFRGVSIFYSGDGKPSAAAEDMAQGVDLAVMECFEGTGLVPGHNNLAGVLGFMEQAVPDRVALVHVRSGARTELMRLLADAAASERLFMPRCGDVVEL